MASLTIHNLDDETLHDIKEKAQSIGIAVEDYVTEILHKSTPHPKSKNNLLKQSQQIRSQTAIKQKTNTLELLHESRKER